MSTESIFLAGAKLGSYVLGKVGPIQVNYYNWRREPLEISSLPRTNEDSSNDTTSSNDVGGLGILLLGRKEKFITFDDIEELIQTLEDANYFAHYPLVDVYYDDHKRQITFDWTT